MWKRCLIVLFLSVLLASSNAVAQYNGKVNAVASSHDHCCRTNLLLRGGLRGGWELYLSLHRRCY